MYSFLTAQKSAKLKRVKRENTEHDTRHTQSREIRVFPFAFDALHRNADVAKLADALDLGSSSREGV